MDQSRSEHSKSYGCRQYCRAVGLVARVRRRAFDAARPLPKTTDLSDDASDGMLKRLPNRLERMWLEVKLQRFLFVPCLTTEVREEIAGHVYRWLWGPLMVIVALGQIVILATVGVAEPTRFIPGLVWLFALLLARNVTRRRGALKGLRVVVGGLVVSTTFAVLAHSVHAPGYVANVLALAVVVPLYGPRAGALLTLWCACCGAIWLVMDRVGWTLGIVYPSSLYAYTFMLGCMACGIGLMSIPSALLSVALRASEQRRMDAELSRQAEQNAERAFRAVFEQTGALNALLQPDGTILRLNLTGERLFGMDGASCMGQSFLAMPWANGDAVASLERALARAIDGTERLEIAIANPPGGRRNLQLAIAPIVSLDGQIRTLVVEGLDVTRLIDAERALAHSRRLEALGKLAGGVAHDFNNMLLAMQGALESLRSRKLGQDEQFEAMDTMDAAVSRASDLTRKLLAFGRRDLFESQILDLEALICQATPMLQGALGTSIELVVELQSASHWVEGDSAAIEHTLINLMVNARDAMPAGGRVTLRTSVVAVDESWCERQSFPVKAGSLVVVAVKDCGVGMTDEVRSRAFEPFFTTKALGESSGLGLPAVHGTMLAHGGGVTIESRLGEGTELCLYFPLAKQRVSARVPPSGIGFSPQLRGTVLVVDDEPLVLRVAKRYLEKLGVDVVLSPDAPTALALLESRPTFDCVLTDVVMPNMNGAMLVEKIRSRYPDLPIVVMSGFPAGAEAGDHELLAACPWLRKPFGRNDLAKVLGPILGGTPEQSEGSVTT